MPGPNYIPSDPTRGGQGWERHERIPPPDQSAYRAMRADPDYIEVSPNHFMRRETILRHAESLPWRYVELARDQVISAAY